MFTDNKNFYPTSEKLVFKMLEKLRGDKLGMSCISSITYVLEPSCGKGNIIEAYEKYYETNCKRNIEYNKKASDYVKFDAIELDENLNKLLKGKGINVVGEDYLTFEPQRFYDLIIQNPPFDEGDKHLLASIRIQSRIGGKILCLLNAETLKNPYSNTRKELVQLIKQYNGQVEYIENAFSDSERETDVETALVYIDVPMISDDTIFERHFKRDNPDIHIDSFKALMPNKNLLEKMCFECDLIKKSTTELFKEKMRINTLLDGFGLKSKVSICDDSCNPKVLTINEYINKINLSYWQKFIEISEFKNKLPSKLRDNFSYNMEKQKDIAFNIESVRYFYEQLIQSIPKSYEETVAKVFDTLTYKSYYSDTMWNSNIYLYSGWKTNSCYKINNKSIIGYYGDYMYRVPETLNDLNIIFNNIKGTKYNIDTNEIVEAIKRCDKNIETEHFILDCYKKQTIHIKYKNKEHLQVFNILSGKGKNALPPDFGQKSYSSMDEEEKRIVKDFGLTIDEYDTFVLNQASSNNYLRLN